MNKNLASRKRSSPLPNLVEQYDAKRERRLSSHGSETSTVSSSEGSSSKIRCRKRMIRKFSNQKNTNYLIMWVVRNLIKIDEKIDRKFV